MVTTHKHMDHYIFPLLALCCMLPTCELHSVIQANLVGILDIQYMLVYNASHHNKTVPCICYIQYTIHMVCVQNRI